MNDDIDETGPTDDEWSLADGPLAGLLGDPGVWVEADPGLEDSIVAAITAEAAARPDLTADTGLVESPTDSNVVPISASRRWFGPAVAGVAAALTLLVGGLILTSGDDEPGGLEVALAPTDLAPGAEALARVAETPLGTRIILDVSGLPPAEPGTYYEAWMRVDAEVGVSAGTFHLRGGDGEIELWSGVTANDYPLFTITVQNEGQAASSGVVVLRGLITE